MIRRAEEKDLSGVNNLLRQVLTVHANLHPDIFIPETKKYTDSQLLEIFNNPKTPVFVYEDENEEDSIVGYAFCIFEETKCEETIYDMLTLYIDDICVDREHRRKGIARALYEYVLAFAKESGCDRITLNVWEGNDSAKMFYEDMGMKPLKTMMYKSLKG